MQEPEVKVFDSLNLSGGVDMCEIEQMGVAVEVRDLVVSFSCPQ
jgi:hypothetical protein